MEQAPYVDMEDGNIRARREIGSRPSRRRRSRGASREDGGNVAAAAAMAEIVAGSSALPHEIVEDVEEIYEMEGSPNWTNRWKSYVVRINMLCTPVWERGTRRQGVCVWGGGEVNELDVNELGEMDVNAIYNRDVNVELEERAATSPVVPDRSSYGYTHHVGVTGIWRASIRIRRAQISRSPGWAPEERPLPRPVPASLRFQQSRRSPGSGLLVKPRLERSRCGGCPL